MEKFMTVSASRPVRVVGVSSGKGGAGKTNVCVNLGLALSGLGQRVTLLDADLGLANVDVLLGLKPTRTLQHVLSGECSLADVLMEMPGGLKIVPASSGVREMAALGPRGQAEIIAAFNSIADSMDVLLVGTAAGISPDVLGFLAATQEVLVVVCNEPTSITDGYALMKVLNQTHGVDRFRVVVNMVGPGERGQAVFEKLRRVTDRFLDVCLDYSGAIPMDPQLRKAVSRQRAVVEAFPASESARAFDALARRVQTWPMPAGPRGHLEFFIENLVAQGKAV
jgi:flagellar biosynthesis protein FlhG